MTPLETIERQCWSLAQARADLTTVVDELEDEVRAVMRRFRRRLEQQKANTVAAHNRLVYLVESNPSLFDKPKTQVMHGIKVGYRKSPGGIAWDDDDQLVKLIEKHLKSSFDLLVKTTYRPIRAAINELDVSDLRKIGARVEKTGDVVVVKPIKTDIDKRVDALLAEEINEQTAEPAVVAGR